MIRTYRNKGIKTIAGKNIFKSIVKTDRYGNRYVKNFRIDEDGVSLQTFDSQNYRIKHHYYRFVAE